MKKRSKPAPSASLADTRLFLTYVLKEGQRLADKIDPDRKGSRNPDLPQSDAHVLRVLSAIYMKADEGISLLDVLEGKHG